MADEVNALQEMAGGQVVLIGHSIGCKIIREAYCRKPDGIAGLVFINGAFYGTNARPMREGARLYIETNGYPAFIRDYFGAASGGATNPGFLRSAIERAQRLDPGFGRDFYLSGVDFDHERAEATLACIKVPVLVLQSCRIDPSGRRVAIQAGDVTPFMDRVLRVVPGAEVVTITGSSHFPMLDRKAAVSEEIRAFADAIDKGTKGRTAGQQRTI